MNTFTLRSFRRIAAGLTLLSTIVAAVPAQARPQDFVPPALARSAQSEDARLWRWVPRGPRGAYEPVEGSRVIAMPNWDEADRWIGPRNSVPFFDKG